MRGQTENALKGKSNGGARSLGYVTDENQYFAIDPQAAPIVQEVFQRYADGETVTEIINTLNSKGFKTRTGGEFNKNSLHRMLQNRRYIGEYRYREVIDPSGIPRIIDDALFDRVQERLEKNRKAPATAKAKVDYLLTIKLFCGKCGAFFIGESGTGKSGKSHHYYKCAHAKRGKTCSKKPIRKNEIEQLVIREVKNKILQDNVINSLADDIIAYSGAESALLPSLVGQLTDVNKRIENVMRAIEEGVITPTTKQRLEELELRRDELEVSIAQEKIARPPLTKEQVVFWLGRFKNGNEADEDYCRHVIDIFVNSIYIYDDRICLNLNAREGIKAITLDQMERSDLDAVAPAWEHREGIIGDYI